MDIINWNAYSVLKSNTWFKYLLIQAIHDKRRFLYSSFYINPFKHIRAIPILNLTEILKYSQNNNSLFWDSEVMWSKRVWLKWK